MRNILTDEIRTRMKQIGRVIPFTTVTEKYCFLYAAAHMYCGDTYGTLQVLDSSNSGSYNIVLANWLMEMDMVEFCYALQDFMQENHGVRVTAVIRFANGGQIRYMATEDEDTVCYDDGLMDLRLVLFGRQFAPAKQNDLAVWTEYFMGCTRAMMEAVTQVKRRKKMEEFAPDVCLKLTLDRDVITMFEEVERVDVHGMTAFLMNKVGLSTARDPDNQRAYEKVLDAAEKANCVQQLHQLISDYHAENSKEFVSAGSWGSIPDAVTVVRSAVEGNWQLDLAIGAKKTQGMDGFVQSGVFFPCLIVTRKDAGTHERCYINEISCEELLKGYESCFEFRTNTEECTLVMVDASKEIDAKEADLRRERAKFTVWF